ncbi:MAG TPA: glycosyltransferase family protein [Bacteroidia bacterium]|nr:glycosyltransferase family protein [Bacteroidia bacterium]
MAKQLHVLYSVLDWGLGHATRSIPVIRELLANDCKVSLAGEGNSLVLLQQSFPDLPSYPLKGIHVTYPTSGSMTLAMIKQLPAINHAIKSEQAQFEKLVRELKPDLVFSDNRYGARCDDVYSIFMGHQLWIQAPPLLKWTEGAIFQLHKKMIKNFDECWVPDYSGEINLSGQLSHHPKVIDSLHPVFIGPLSRLRLSEIKQEVITDILVIVSGPEPQRSIFEEKCRKQAEKTGLKTLIVQGQPHLNNDYTFNNIRTVSHLNEDELAAAICNATYVVCRSGYSTLMDLAALKKNALCVPTPSQTEQEYLAMYLSEQELMVIQSQFDIDFDAAFIRLNHLKPFSLTSGAALKTNIERICHKLRN